MIDPLAIAAIANDLVACDKACAGICRDQQAGILPRCLVLEEAPQAQENAMGCALVGLNPGRSSEEERTFYIAQGATHDAVLAWFNHQLPDVAYYTRLKRFVDQLGLRGDVLWTELAKCENAHGSVGAPPLPTLRTCASHFLLREISEVPAEWPLIAVGRESYRALAYMFPNRPILGVPHPTGAYGGAFHRLFVDNNLLLALRPEVAAAANAAMFGVEPGLIWLSEVLVAA